MALYGVYGSHTVDSCPVNNRSVAEKVVAIGSGDMSPMLAKYQISEVKGMFHSAFEHTFVWVFEAQDAHQVQGFLLEAGIAAWNDLKIVPLMTFSEGVMQMVKQVHGL